MKKPVAISLLLLYIIASSGVSLEARYSDGKLQSIALVVDHSPERICPDSRKSGRDQRHTEVASNSDTSQPKSSHTSIGDPVREVLRSIGAVSQILSSGL